jgi:type IV pilus assembly protein PilV
MKKKAFTLIEVLLAVFVLEIGLLGIAGFYAKSFQIAKTARNQTTASNLAAGILDEQLSKSYDALVSVSETAYSTAPAFSNFRKQIDMSCIKADLALIDCNDANAHMKKILVTIFWTENNSEKSFQESTIMVEP